MYLYYRKALQQLINSSICIAFDTMLKLQSTIAYFRAVILYSVWTICLFFLIIFHCTTTWLPHAVAVTLAFQICVSFHVLLTCLWGLLQFDLIDEQYPVISQKIQQLLLYIYPVTFSIIITWVITSIIRYDIVSFILTLIM